MRHVTMCTQKMYTPRCQDTVSRMYDGHTRIESRKTMPVSAFGSITNVASYVAALHFRFANMRAVKIDIFGTPITIYAGTANQLPH